MHTPVFILGILVLAIGTNFKRFLFLKEIYYELFVIPPSYIIIYNGKS